MAVLSIRANKDNKGPQAPDVIDVGLSFGPTAKSEGLLAPYKVSTWKTIPDSAKDKPQEGEVISTGKGRTNDEGKTFPLAVKEGDRILFGKYSGTEIKIDGEDFIIMKEDEVLGILTGAASPAKKETAGSRR